MVPLARNFERSGVGAHLVAHRVRHAPERAHLKANPAIREAVLPVFLAVERARHDGAAGLRVPDLRGALGGAGPLLDASPDELAAGPPRLLRLAIEARRLARTAASEEALVAADMAKALEGPWASLSLRAGRAAVAVEKHRERRRALAEVVLRAEHALEGARADHLELVRDVIAEVPGPSAGGDDVLEGARRLLATTADATREALEHAARRHLGLRSVEDLEASDVDFLLSGLPASAAFPSGGTRLLAMSLLEGIGLSPVGRGLKLDLERRPGKLAGPQAARLGREDRAVASLLPVGAPCDLRGLLDALGRATFLLELSRRPAPEDRVGGDLAAIAGLGLALSFAVLEPSFHRRILRSTGREAEAAVRLLQLGELIALRRACARAISAHELLADGPGKGHAGVHVEWMRQADLAAHDPREHLAAALAPGAALVEIRAHARAGRVIKDLAEAFGDDWFRNPRTGPYLSDLMVLDEVTDDLSHASERLLERLA